MSTKIVQYIHRKKILCSTCAKIKEQKQFANKNRKVRTCVANASGPLHLWNILPYLSPFFLGLFNKLLLNNMFVAFLPFDKRLCCLNRVNFDAAMAVKIM